METTLCSVSDYSFPVRLSFQDYAINCKIVKYWPANSMIFTVPLQTRIYQNVQTGLSFKQHKIDQSLEGGLLCDLVSLEAHLVKHLRLHDCGDQEVDQRFSQTNDRRCPQTLPLKFQPFQQAFTIINPQKSLMKATRNSTNLFITILLR